MTTLNNQNLLNFVDRIKLSQEKKSSYSSQIENLIRKVRDAVQESDSTTVYRVIRAGSWKKGTALAPKGDYPLDADIVFFLKIDDHASFDAEELRKEIINVLCKAYPTKKKSDFSNGKKTIGITFIGSGLEVDVVPFVPQPPGSEYGLQPHKKLNSGNFETSVDGQLEFVKKVKRRNSNFAPAVRILKFWRNYQELELPSFTIELVVAELIESNRVSPSNSISNLVLRFFEELGSDRILRISFYGAKGRVGSTTPWVSDPTNNANNSLSQISSSEWREIKSEAETAFETITYAEVVLSKPRTIKLWKEIFGPSFSIEKA